MYNNIELPIKAYDYDKMLYILSLIKTYQNVMNHKSILTTHKRYYDLELLHEENKPPILKYTHINKMGGEDHAEYSIKEMRLTSTGGLKVYTINDSKLNFAYEWDKSAIRNNKINKII